MARSSLSTIFRQILVGRQLLVWLGWSHPATEQHFASGQSLAKQLLLSLTIELSFNHVRACNLSSGHDNQSSDFSWEWEELEGLPY